VLAYQSDLKENSLTIRRAPSVDSAYLELIVIEGKPMHFAGYKTGGFADAFGLYQQ